MSEMYIYRICTRLSKLEHFYKDLYFFRKHKVAMFEARLISSGTLKKVLDSIKDLLTEATFDCSDSGIQVRITISLDVSFY